MIEQGLRKLKDIMYGIYMRAELGVFHKPTIHRYQMLKLALAYVRDEKVKGDYFEFGVARGTTFITAFHLSRKYNTGIKTFHALDSFEGFPEPKGVDKKFERFKKGEAKFSLNVFNKNLVKKKVNSKQVRVVKGWFKDTLNKELLDQYKKKNNKIAIAWIDCDLYESTREVLFYIRPLITQGTVLIFDDWYCYRSDPKKGERRAVSEFLEKYPDVELIPYSRFGVVGNSFIVNIKGEN